MAVWRVGGQETVQLIKGNITLERSYHGCCCLAAIKLKKANVAVETVTYRHFKFQMMIQEVTKMMHDAL